MDIVFQPFQTEHISLWERWIQNPHVKDVWFIEGYEPTHYIYQKIEGNGYDYPFVIFMNNLAIGYIVCCDLYAYRTICPHPKGIFTKEDAGTFCMDLFIAEESYLNKGYGTKIVKSFIKFIFNYFNAKIILIDPAISNKRAIRCYEKTGFKFLKEAFDGITNCYVMIIECETSIAEKNQQKFLEIRKLELPAGQYAITGSGPLGIRNLREINDIDIIVTQELWETLAKKHGIIKEKGIQKIVFPGGLIEVLYYEKPLPNSEDPTILQRIAEAEMIDKLPFESLKNTLYYKLKMNREKDLNDIAMIKDWEKK